MNETNSITKRLLQKIAWAYYEEGLTQKQVGERFGLSRIKVSRLLQKAREQNVVQIYITPIDSPNFEIEKSIEERYGLDEVIIVQPTEVGLISHQDLGAAAAAYVQRSLQGHERIAITWGSRQMKYAKVIQLPVFCIEV